jgi:hypothetical protein
MSENIKSFLFGFTNAFRPIDYSEVKDLGKMSKQINDKISINRRLTIGKINEITKKSGITKSF